MKLYNFSDAYNRGFTLVELSIVLVIIGLVIGGVLTGQELIKAAEQRATVSQIGKYNTAVNAFRNKYGGIPGDLAAAKAFNYHITNNISFAGTAGVGDNNGIIDSVFGNNAGFLCEPPMFWLELSAAELIEGSYLTSLTTNGLIPTAVPAVPASTYMPTAKLSGENYITVGSANGSNYFVLTGISAISTIGSITSTNNIMAQDAFDIDSKIDDGFPSRGRVRAIDPVTRPLLMYNSLNTNAVNATAPDCVTASAAYAIDRTTPACSMIVRFN